LVSCVALRKPRGNKLYGEGNMQGVMNPRRAPDEPIDERASRELAKLIRKLRWIGNDDEAKKLEVKLRTGTRVCVLATPRETD